MLDCHGTAVHGCDGRKVWTIAPCHCAVFVYHHSVLLFSLHSRYICSTFKVFWLARKKYKNAKESLGSVHVAFVKRQRLFLNVNIKGGWRHLYRPVSRTVSIPMISIIGLCLLKIFALCQDWVHIILHITADWIKRHSSLPGNFKFKQKLIKL